MEYMKLMMFGLSIVARKECTNTVVSGISPLCILLTTFGLIGGLLFGSSFSWTRCARLVATCCWVPIRYAIHCLNALTISGQVVVVDSTASIMSMVPGPALNLLINSFLLPWLV